MPKKITALLLIAILFISMASFSAAEDTPAWAEDGVLRILGVGNSYTEDTYWQLYDVAKMLGFEHVEIYICMISACTITRHIFTIEQQAASYTLHVNTNGIWKTTKNVKLQDVAAIGGWDFVSMQELSSSAGDPISLGDAARLGALLKSLCPDAELVWNMTWAYPNEYSTPEFISLYHRDSTYMYKSIIQTTQDLIIPLSCVDRIIPNGTAIQNARETYLGDSHTLLFRDKLHLSMYEGRTIAAMNTLATLTGVDIAPLEKKLKNSEFAQAAVEAVKNAQVNPWSVTKSMYPSQQAEQRAAESAEKMRYIIQTKDYDDNAGGWALFAFGDYNYLGSAKRGKQFGVVFAQGDYGSQIQLTVPEEGPMNLAYMYNPPTAVPGYLKNCSLSLKVYVLDRFDGSLTFRLCNGNTINLKDSRCWNLKGDALSAGWNDLILTAEDAAVGGYFDTKQFKGLQISLDAPAGLTISIADIALITD